MTSCDFCSKDEPGVWAYPAHDVDMGLGQRSLGEWHACEACHGFLAAGDLVGLEVHAVDVLARKMPDLTPAQVRAWVIEAHRAFQRARYGEPRRLSLPDT